MLEPPPTQEWFNEKNLPRRLCVRHPWWRLQCVAGHCYYQLPVFLSFSLPCLLLLTYFGETPEDENLFPQYFGITRRNIHFLFFTKKSWFWGVFFLFAANVRSRPPGPPLFLGVFFFLSFSIKCFSSLRGYPENSYFVFLVASVRYILVQRTWEK